MLSDHLQSPSWLLRRLEAPAAAPAQVRLAALAGDTMLLASDTIAHVHVGTALDPVVLSLDWPPAALALAPSGRFALLVSAQRGHADVIGLPDGERLLTIGRLDDRSGPVTSTFASADGEELLVVSRERFVLEAISLPAGTPRFRAEFTTVLPFFFDSLHTLLDGDTLVAIGHGESESKDSLVTLSLRLLTHDPVMAAHEAVGGARPADYAYRLAAGPCGRDAMVAFRDPEGDETPEEDVPATGSDLEDFHGLYIRRLANGRLVERIPHDLPIESGAPLFATDHVIAAGGPRGVELVPRGIAREFSPVRLDAAVYAFDPLTRRIALVQQRGTIDLYQFRDGKEW
jgi:hypothetical protein